MKVTETSCQVLFHNIFQDWKRDRELHAVNRENLISQVRPGVFTYWKDIQKLYNHWLEVHMPLAKIEVRKSRPAAEIAAMIEAVFHAHREKGDRIIFILQQWKLLC